MDYQKFGCLKISMPKYNMFYKWLRNCYVIFICIGRKWFYWTLVASIFEISTIRTSKDKTTQVKLTWLNCSRFNDESSLNFIFFITWQSRNWNIWRTLYRVVLRLVNILKSLKRFLFSSVTQTLSGATGPYRYISGPLKWTLD